MVQTSNYNVAEFQPPNCPQGNRCSTMIHPRGSNVMFPFTLITVESTAWREANKKIAA